VNSGYESNCSMKRLTSLLIAIVVLGATTNVRVVNAQDASDLAKQCLELLNQSKYEDAISYCDKALEIDPNNIDALNNKAMALSDLGRYEEAISSYDRALEIDPNDGNALHNKGIALGKLGKNESDAIWNIAIYLVVGGGLSYAIYRVKTNRYKHVSNASDFIKEPFFAVLKIQWAGTNITYLMIFDESRVLFIRPDKIRNESKNLSLDALLNTDERNFQIPFNNIRKVELNKSRYGVSGKVRKNYPNI